MSDSTDSRINDHAGEDAAGEGPPGKDADVIDLAVAADPRDAVHRAAGVLVEGGTVAMPLECPPAYVRLATAATPRPPEATAGSTQACGLLFDHVAAAADFLPPLTPAQSRLVLRSWPGEVIFEVTPEIAGPLDELPGWVASACVREGFLSLRVDGRDATGELAAVLPAPLVYGPSSVLGDASLTLVDSAAADPAGPASVVRLSGESWQLRQAGVVGEADLKQRLGVQIVMVCTGNTCRSPMAEVALRRMLATELGVAEADLAEAGVRVLSAGIAAGPGSPASAYSAKAVAADGLDLSGHRSRRATVDLLSGSDLILTMTQGHRATIVSSVPELAPLVHVLNPGGRDVADPIGGSAAQYRACYDEITAGLRARLASILQLAREAAD